MRTKNFIGVNVDCYTICLYNVKKVMGHDDSLPFNASFEIYKDNKVLFSGSCWNTGWGGSSEFSMAHGTYEDLMPIDELCKDRFTYKFRSYDIRHGLFDIFDILAEKYIFNSPYKNHVYSEKAFMNGLMHG